MLGEELLGAARAVTGRPELAFAEPPVRLDGGFFTENHAFRLASAPEPWDGSLVVRLFPNEAPPDLARRESAVQRVLADQDFPAPGIVWFDDHARLDGRRCFVMRRLPGRPLVGGIRPRELLMSARKVFRRLVDITATAQAQLHRLDAMPLVDDLVGMAVGIERWFERLAAFDELVPALDWLVANRPAEIARPVICHGDLWGGNILTDGDRLTGVVDYTVATVAEPALDVGYTTMSFHLVPIDAPAPIRRLAARLARSISDRYVAAYLAQTGADLTNQPYYEALRCANELTNVISYRRAETQGVRHDAPRPTWDSVVPQMIEYFRLRTGVTLWIPPPAGRDRARGR